jgi:hypothetical protein
MNVVRRFSTARSLVEDECHCTRCGYDGGGGGGSEAEEADDKDEEVVDEDVDLRSESSTLRPVAGRAIESSGQ